MKGCWRASLGVIRCVWREWLTVRVSLSTVLGSGEGGEGSTYLGRIVNKNLLDQTDEERVVVGAVARLPGPPPGGSALVRTKGILQQLLLRLGVGVGQLLEHQLAVDLSKQLCLLLDVRTLDKGVGELPERGRHLVQLVGLVAAVEHREPVV